MFSTETFFNKHSHFCVALHFVCFITGRNCMEFQPGHSREYTACKAQGEPKCTMNMYWLLHWDKDHLWERAEKPSMPKTHTCILLTFVLIKGFDNNCIPLLELNGTGEHACHYLHWRLSSPRIIESGGLCVVIYKILYSLSCVADFPALWQRILIL